MKVTHIITGLEVGGAESFLASLLPPLSARHASEVITLTTRGPLAERIEASGTPVRALGMTGLDAPAKVLKLADWLRRDRPDIVQTWLYHADLLGGVAARLAGVTTLMWNIRQSQLSPDYIKRRSIMVARAGALLSPVLPDVIVCVAEAAKRAHAAMGYDAAKLVVIPNGIDTNRFRPDPEARLRFREQIGAGPYTRVLGMVGRFDPQKNHGGFLEMAAKVRQDWPDSIYVLAGRGVDESASELRERVGQLQLSSSVRFVGLQKKIETMLPGLDIFVSPSHDEGFPNAVAEAMACGVPCVVTDAGDSMIVVGDTGLCVPRFDAALLADAAVLLLRETPVQQRSRSQRSRARVIEQFSLEAAAARYGDLYDHVARVPVSGA